jgi:hypothetical protein
MFPSQPENVATTASIGATTATNVAMPPARITFPNPTKRHHVCWTFGTWQQGESKIQKGPSLVLERKGKNLVVMHEKKQDLLVGKGDMSILQTTPERKPAIVIFVMTCAQLFNLQDYSYLSHNNQPRWYPLG